MRRVALVLAAIMLTLLVASGVALAVNKVGDNGPNTLRGTNEGDNLVGQGGNDDIFGLGGRDAVVGGAGRDVMQGGPPPPRPEVPPRCEASANNNDDLTGGAGNDFLWVRDTPFPVPPKDLVLCGAGWDVASVDRVDVVVGCERLMFRHPTHEEHVQVLAKRGLGGRV
jgi:Ca2+-binding RTX toxin-like protein